MSRPEGKTIKWDNINNLIKEKGWTQKELAAKIQEELNKTDLMETFTPGGVSAMKEKGRTSEKTLHALVKIFHPVIKDYIQGFSEYRTLAEKEEAIINQSVKEYENTRDYLKTLGIETEIALYWKLYGDELEKIGKHYYTSTKLLDPENRSRYGIVDFLSDSEKDKLNKLLDKYPKLDGIHYFEVSADMLQNLKEKIKGSQIKLNGWSGGAFFFTFEENLIPHNPYLEARYKIIINNNAAGSVSIRKMNSLFNAIKNSTQGILTAFMDSQDFTDDLKD